MMVVGLSPGVGRRWNIQLNQTKGLLYHLAHSQEVHSHTCCWVAVQLGYADAIQPSSLRMDSS